MLSSIESIEILGGVNVGKSSADGTLYDRNAQERHIMVDCGLQFPKNNGEGYVLPLRPKKRPDVIATTHAHNDHFVLGPRYLADYGSKFYMTGPTFFLGEYMLDDHLKVSEIKGVPPLFNQKEKADFMISDQTETVYHSYWINLWPGVDIRFDPAGHGIRGAAMVSIRTDTKTVTFSGDICTQSTPTVLGILPPDDFVPDVLITESTNGMKKLPERQGEIKRLIEIAARFRLALIPAFSLGRSPDTALDLVSYGYPTFLDGMGQKILRECCNPRTHWCPNDVPISKTLMRRINFVGRNRDSVALDRQPKAVVTTGGMMNGPALAYAVEHKWLSDPEAAVLIVGYQTEGTPGRKLLDGLETGMPFKLGDGEDAETIKVEAHIERFYLSGHIDGPDNVKFTKTWGPKKVYVGHGEDESRQAVAAAMVSEGIDAHALKNEGEVIAI